MRKIYASIITICISAMAFAQIPSNYYNGITTQTGFTLKTALRNIIANGHSSRSYDQLYDGVGVSGSQGYVDTHSDINVSSGNNYENDATILDMYSENPTGNDPYNYTHGNNQCGNQNSEGDCYNREHLVPQSSFNSNFPMQSDIHHVIPTDGRVNNFRGSLPFGNVGSANWTSLNGSRRGSSAMAGYSGTVFEPIDEFKGDIARALLYFATRYENSVDGYTSFDMFNGTEDQVFFTWAIDVLLDWHNNVDPVDQRERNRNDEAYNFQGNANPFVDHPEYADLIWNPTPDTEAPTDPTNLVASNPSDTTIDINWTASTDNVGVASYDIYVDNVNTFNTTNTSFTVIGLTANTNYCFKIKAKDIAQNESSFSNEDCETTTDNGSGSSECASETFENIPANNGTYTDRMWTGDNGLTWNATEARTDQTINGRALLIDGRGGTSGVLTSPSVPGGIGNLTVTTQRFFSGGSGDLSLYVNGVLKGSIPYEDTIQMTTISNINVEGNVVISFSEDTSGGDRIGIDDLSWTCYTSLGVDDFNISNINIYPNPAKEVLNINLINNITTQIEIFDILGKKVFHSTLNRTSTINLQALKTGIYIIKITQNDATISKKLIKQ